MLSYAILSDFVSILRIMSGSILVMKYIDGRQRGRIREDSFRVHYKIEQKGFDFDIISEIC